MKEKTNWRKNMVLGLLLLAALFSLGGCGDSSASSASGSADSVTQVKEVTRKSGKNEKEILADLNASQDFFNTITSYDTIGDYIPSTNYNPTGHYKEQPREILEHAKKGYGGGRYSCVNLQNRDTVEFRMFRGTLRYSTLIATLQLVDHLCELSVALTDEEIKALSWTSFVSGIDADIYPQLIAYLKERRLYTNEPVPMAVEV